jgi:hypothetical protein
VITEAPKARLDCPGPDEVWSLEMLAPDGLPVATLSDPQGEGRLSARWIETGAGKVLAGVWDAQLGTMCAPALTIENATVCVPVANVEDMGYFGESLCLNRLLTSVNCAPARFLTVVESLMSRRLAEVKSLEPYTGMVFESRNRACGPAGGDQRQVAGPHFSEGARVPLSDLAALHETIQ